MARDRDHLVERRVAEDAAGGSAVLERAGAEAEELQPARLAREAVDDDVGERVVGALVHHRDHLDRILRAVLRDRRSSATRFRFWSSRTRS